MDAETERRRRCDHEVGTGKTLIMCIAAHEMKTVLAGSAKPMIIGLKANVAEIAMISEMPIPMPGYCLPMKRVPRLTTA